MVSISAAVNCRRMPVKKQSQTISSGALILFILKYGKEETGTKTSTAKNQAPLIVIWCAI